MTTEVKVPSPGESITEVQLASWLVKDGDFVERDAEIAEIDSDKATLTINAPTEGTISIKVAQGDTLSVGAVIAIIDSEGTAKKAGETDENKDKKEGADTSTKNKTSSTSTVASPEAPSDKGEDDKKAHITPLARKMMEANNLTSDEVLRHTGNKRISKADIETVAANRSAIRSSGEETKPGYSGNGEQMPQESKIPVDSELPSGSRNIERKKLSSLRIKLSQRLVAVKNETAMLTTFNEVNMSSILQIKKQYNEKFKEKYGVSIGFMSLFSKAVTIALQQFPQVNSVLEGEELIYHDYVDIGIAVSSPKGLVVPVIRNTESMSIPEIEIKIKELASKASNNKISLDEMTGGTFTISNGGVFGSMLSTPILNPPQSAILGMHNIIERPIALNGQIIIAPMMYLALSYDHRVIDGRESVSFLVKVKELLENPSSIFYSGKDPVKGILGL